MYIFLVGVYTLHSRNNDSKSAHSLSALIFSFAGSSLFCFIYLSLWVVITITMIILGTMFCLKRITFIPHSYDNRCYVIVFYFLCDTEMHYYVFFFYSQNNQSDAMCMLCPTTDPITLHPGYNITDNICCFRGQYMKVKKADRKSAKNIWKVNINI